jgi:hypothetical protein
VAGDRHDGTAGESTLNTQIVGVVLTPPVAALWAELKGAAASHPSAHSSTACV